MARWVWFGCAALVVSLAGCAGKSPAAGAADGAVADASSPPDAPPAPTSCRTIRICVYACQADAACIARCQSSAPQAARAQYEQIRSCSMQACPNQDDVDCRCMQECLDGGNCSTAVDDCDEAGSDPFCDTQCH